MWLLIYLIFCKRDTRLCYNIDCKKKKNSFYSSFSRFKYLFLSRKKIRLYDEQVKMLIVLIVLIVIFSKICSSVRQFYKSKKEKSFSIEIFLSLFSFFFSFPFFFSLLLHQKGIGELNHKKKKFQKRNRYFGFLYRSLVLILLSWSNFKTVIQFLKESIIEMVRYGNKGNYRRYN